MFTIEGSLYLAIYNRLAIDMLPATYTGDNFNIKYLTNVKGLQDL